MNDLSYRDNFLQIGEVMKDFKKSDLKDGMVVKLRDTNNDPYVKFGDSLFSIHKNKLSFFENLCDYTEEMIEDSVKDPHIDIMSVYYEGEHLWQRDEWVKVTPLEAMAALAKKGSSIEGVFGDYRDRVGYTDTLVGVTLFGQSNYYTQRHIWSYCKLKRSDLV